MTAESPLTHWEGEPVRVWEGVWGIPELTVLNTVDSTNLVIRRRSELPQDFTTVIAEEQSAGRGRAGAAWSSPAGGLFMSWVFRPRSAAATPLVPLRVGLAVAKAIEGLHGIEVGIKWPNDVWVDGRKLAGILCEGGPNGVVVGVGINVRVTPGDISFRRAPIGLDERVGAATSRAGLAGAILKGAQELLGRGGGVLRPEELAELAQRDVLRDRLIRVVPGPQGQAIGMDEHGRLGIRAEDEIQRVSSGSIELLDD